MDVRAATPDDVKDIKKLLSFYCLETEKVEKNLPEFIVAVLDNKIVGCACLDRGDVVELRSIAVLPNYRHKGIGSKLIDSIIKRAAGLADAVYLLTTSSGFFEKRGGIRLADHEKKSMWTECKECDKFDICKQVLMKFNLNPGF